MMPDDPQELDVYPLVVSYKTPVLCCVSCKTYGAMYLLYFICFLSMLLIRSLISGTWLRMWKFRSYLLSYAPAVAKRFTETTITAIQTFPMELLKCRSHSLTNHLAIQLRTKSAPSPIRAPMPTRAMSPTRAAVSTKLLESKEADSAPVLLWFLFSFFPPLNFTTKICSSYVRSYRSHWIIPYVANLHWKQLLPC